MTDVAESLFDAQIPAFAAFIPFGTLVIKFSYNIMPLRWISLASMLELISLLSIYVNITANDLAWTILGIWTYIIVSLPIYMTAKAHRVANNEEHRHNFTFLNLFKTCAKAVFSDYRISLLSKISLTIQVFAGGSLLYEIFGADWILHALAGFGVGALALKAYVTAVKHYGYDRLASYFHLDRIRAFKVERKTGSAEFALFSIIIVSLAWEIFERIVHFLSPVNVFRVAWEPFWNIFGDVVSAIIGSMVAWYIIKCKLKWL